MTIQEHPARSAERGAAELRPLFGFGKSDDGLQRPSARASGGMIAGLSVAAGVTAFVAICFVTRAELPVPAPAALGIATLVTVGMAALMTIRMRSAELSLLEAAIPIAVLASGGTLLALTTVYQFAGYFRVPADLLSFAESPFVTDILKFRLGLPIYTPPQDGNSYSYTPGTQILTYLLASLFGHGDSIPFFRVVQFSYVIAAAAIAASVFDLLARQFLSQREYRLRPIWIVAAFPLLLLVSTDPHVNLYVQSLHNDGLSLLISVAAYWLIARYAVAPRAWLLVAMVVVPALGFLVKQNTVMWLGLFPVYLLVAGGTSLRRVAFVAVVGGSLVAAVVGVCFLLWGEPFRFWVFQSLGGAEVSPLRSLFHVFQAGVYVVMALVSSRLLLFRALSRTAVALWLCWILPFGLEVYTSGMSWQANHLGSGVVLTACWSLVALVKFWPTVERTVSRWHHRVDVLIALSSVFVLLGALGLVREPRSLVPPDMNRYIADIEREFDGIPADQVLMDTGSWIYLRDGILMKDRSAPISQLTAINVPMDQADLGDTIHRIENKQYAKILARQLDTTESWYDFHDRGSGVKSAILDNYQVIRRIPAVQGIDMWWPLHLVSEILVLVPR